MPLITARLDLLSSVASFHSWASGEVLAGRRCQITVQPSTVRRAGRAVIAVLHASRRDRLPRSAIRTKARYDLRRSRPAPRDCQRTSRSRFFWWRSCCASAGTGRRTSRRSDAVNGTLQTASGWLAFSVSSRFADLQRLPTFNVQLSLEHERSARPAVIPRAPPRR